MKILIYDNNLEDLAKLCKMIESLPLDFYIDKISHYEDCVALYDKYQYGIVFIDFTDDIGKKFLAYILEKNPKQRIVTISDEHECSEEDGCFSCSQKYNKQRVIKPITISELIKILTKQQVCSSYCSDNLLIQLEVIAKDISSLVFDKKDFTFMRKEQNYHKEMAEMIQLTYALAEKNIKFKVVDGGIEISKEPLANSNK